MLVLKRNVGTTIVVEKNTKSTYLGFDTKREAVIQVMYPCGMTTTLEGLKTQRPVKVADAAFMTLLLARAGFARLGIDAPESVRILRAEIIP